MPGRKRDGGVKVDPGVNWRVADSRNIAHEGDGLYSYSGQGEESEDDIGTLWTVQPLDPRGGTFEVKIVNTGERNCIAVGVCHHGYPPNSLPGWKETSVAFHADEGNLFLSSDDPQALNLPCKAGDSIRCSVIPGSPTPSDPGGVLIRFCCNGSRIAQVPIRMPAGGIYGIVGMMSKGERVQVQPLLLSQSVDFETLWTVLTPNRIAHEGGGRCAYIGPTHVTQQSVGTLRKNTKIDSSSPGGNCLQVQILEAGNQRCIAVGVCSKSYPIDMLPGWDEPSVGYHADNGQVFKNNEGQPTGQLCQTGDIIKCTVEPVDGSMKEVWVMFHRNEAPVARTCIWTPDEGLYFCVGMMNPDEKVSIFLPEVHLPYVSQRLNFADVWEVVPPTVEHRGQGVCIYTGPGGDRSVGTVRSKEPLDPFNGSKSTFEVKIVSAGDHSYIAVGVCSSRYPANIMPGWEESSIGYHADDGCIHQGTTTEHRTSHLCLTGDVMRCTLEPQDGSSKQVAVLFHRNGALVNRVIQWTPSGGFYALVGMMSKGAAVQVLSPLTDPLAVQTAADFKPSEAGPSRHMALPLGNPGPPTSDWTAAGEMSVHPSSLYFPQSGYYRHSSSFSGALPGHQPSPYRPLGPSAFHPLSYHTQERSPYHTQEHSPYTTQEHLPYQTQEHSPYHTTPYHTPERSPYQGQGHTPHYSPYQTYEHAAYHPQGRAAFYPSPSYQPTSFHSVASEPNFNRNPAYGTSQYVQDYSRLPYPQDQYGRTYEQQISMPDPIGVPSGGEFEKSETRRCMSTPPLPTEAPPSVQPSSSHFTVGAALPDPASGVTVTSASVKGQGDVGDGGERSGVDSVGCHAPPAEVGEESCMEVKVDLTGEEGHPAEVKGVLTEDKGHRTEETGSLAEGKVGHTSQSSTAPHGAQRLQRFLSTSALPDVPSLPRASNKFFQYLHNVVTLDTGSLQCSSPVVGDIGFIMSRQPLSEKLPYFEVEVSQVADGGVVQVGLVWNGFPARKLPGMLQGSLAYNLCTGSLHMGAASCRQVSSPCKEGDIIGCKAHLHYKQEVLHQGDSGKIEMAKVEFFRNGCLLGVENVSLPPSGLFPAIGLVGQGTQVKFSRSITLSPETYFSLHPLPAGFVNFTTPPPVDLSWRCLQNAKVSEGGVVSQLLPRSGSSTIIQGSLPFSIPNFFCEVHLQITLDKFTTFSVGVLPEVSSSAKHGDMIPGEAQNSVGFFPLLGFLMTNGVISSTIPDSITSDIKTNGSLLHIGVGIHFNPASSSVAAGQGAQTAEVFFTISQQQLSSIIVTLPPNGLHPTIVFDTDCKADEQALVKIDYPALWPSTNDLPYGFVRGSSGMITKTKTILCNDENSSIRVVQAGFPLSLIHSYYEVTIRNIDGVKPQLAVGVASYRHPLDVLPGVGKDSIAYHAHDGAVYEPSVGRETVAPGNCNAWLKLGCGARFCVDGSSKGAEVFFTVNGQMVSRRLVQIPPLGLFPTIGLQGFTGSLYFNPFAPDPFPDLTFSTKWRLLTNIQLLGQHVSSKLPTKLGLAQLASTTSSSAVTYFTVSLPQPVNRSTGKVFIGFSNSDDTPFGGKQLPTHRSCHLDIVSGTIVWCDPHIHSDDIGSTANGRVLGCGLWKIDDGTTLLFFTLDNQVIHCTPLVGISGPMFRTLCLIDCHTRVSVDACANWPPMSRIGRGWGRSSNLVMLNSRICHSPLQATSSRSPVGFAQAAFPLIPDRPYFEVEITSQDHKKAIAVGLASREYPVNSWIGIQDNSVAYYSDTGKLNAGSSIGKDFGPKLAKGDTVGCGVIFPPNDHTTSRKGQPAEVFFTINGAVVGHKKIIVPHGGLFPTVCLDSTASIMPSFHSKFPPTQGFVSKDWAIAYSICQVGQLICHRGGSSSISLGNVPPRAFCQATAKLSPEKPYFEVEIVNCSNTSTIFVGIGVRQASQATSLEQDLLLYSSTGEIITRRGSHKSTQMSQKYFIGDIIGCSVIHGTQMSVDLYRNGSKVSTVVLPEGPLKTQPLFPVLSLSHPGDAVIPRLCRPLPRWDPSALVGWLRTERVSIRNNVIEYAGGPQPESHDVGAAQMSQSLARPGIAYYEFEVLDTGAACTIGIGAASATNLLSRMPGWDRDSIGYHGDDGCVFRASGSGESFGPAWKRQDIIGLGIRSISGAVEPGSEVQVYFTRNGQELGHVTINVPATGLYPTIGMHSKGEKVKVSTSMSGQCSNPDPGRLAWRALCGVTLRRDHRGLPVLEYCPRQHRTPPSGSRFGVAIAQQPLSKNMQYFEVQLRQFGRMKGISIGVAPRNYSVEMACGYGNDSIGYRTDNGQLYNQSGTGQVFGPIPKAHSTVGCGVSVVPNSTRHCFVFFTYNGSEIGRIRAAIPDGGFYPTITLTSSGDRVAVSFQEAFKPRISLGEHQLIGLLRIVNCSYSNQLLHYSGNSGTDPAIAQFAVALHRESNYYCANVVNLKDTVVVGLATQDFSVKDVPGRSSVSVAYDITNGQIDAVYNVDKCFQFRAPRCLPGDMVGCGIEMSESKSVQGYVFFTRNGMVVQKIELSSVFDDLYPIVGIRSAGNYSTLFMVWSDVQMPTPNNF